MFIYQGVSHSLDSLESTRCDGSVGATMTSDDCGLQIARTMSHHGSCFFLPWINGHFRIRLIGGTYHFFKAYVYGLNFRE